VRAKTEPWKAHQRHLAVYVMSKPVEMIAWVDQISRECCAGAHSIIMKRRVASMSRVRRNGTVKAVRSSPWN
jgi:hypothetical protein